MSKDDLIILWYLLHKFNLHYTQIGGITSRKLIKIVERALGPKETRKLHLQNEIKK